MFSLFLNVFAEHLLLFSSILRIIMNLKQAFSTELIGKEEKLI